MKPALIRRAEMFEKNREQNPNPLLTDSTVPVLFHISVNLSEKLCPLLSGVPYYRAFTVHITVVRRGGPE